MVRYARGPAPAGQDDCWGKRYSTACCIVAPLLACWLEVFFYYLILLPSLKPMYLVEKLRDEILPPDQSPCVLMSDAYNTSVCAAQLMVGLSANRHQSRFLASGDPCVPLSRTPVCAGYSAGQVVGLQAHYYDDALEARSWLVATLLCACLFVSQLMMACHYAKILQGASCLFDRMAKAVGCVTLSMYVRCMFLLGSIGAMFGVDVGLGVAFLSFCFHVDGFLPTSDSRCVLLSADLQAPCSQGATCGAWVNAGRRDYISNVSVITAACSPESGADPDHQAAYWWGVPSGQMFAMMSEIFGSDVASTDWESALYLAFATLFLQVFAVAARRPIAKVYNFFQVMCTGVAVEEIGPVAGDLPAPYGAVPSQ
jgi:hypothetical protein